MIWKLYETPMAVTHTRCDNDSATNCGDQVSLLGRNSADHKVRRNSDRTNEATQARKQTPTSASRYTCPPSSQHMVLHPVQPAKVTWIQETAPSPTDMSGKSKIAKDGLAPDTRPLLRVSRSDSALFPAARRKHTRSPLRVKKSFEAPPLGRRPNQKQATDTRPPLRVSRSDSALLPARPPELLQAGSKKLIDYTWPLRSQQALIRQESLRGLSPLRIPDFVPTIAKCKKQRRDKPPVKTMQFQTDSFAGVTGDTSKQAKEEEVGISSYLQLEIIYPACEIESGTAFPTSALAQLCIAWYVE
jgi:hypothetical protein